MKSEKIALLGMMAAGKTTLGQLLANALSLPFIDADVELERRIDMKIPDVFRLHGEDEFRLLERTLIADLLRMPGPLVIALGGGAYIQDSVRALLRERAVTVYLKVEAEELIKRLEKTDVAMRPVLTQSADWRERTTAVAARRHPVYSEADVVFPADDNDIPGLGERLAALVTRVRRAGGVGPERMACA